MTLNEPAYDKRLPIFTPYDHHNSPIVNY